MVLSLNCCAPRIREDGVEMPVTILLSRRQAPQVMRFEIEGNARECNFERRRCFHRSCELVKAIVGWFSGVSSSG